MRLQSLNGSARERTERAASKAHGAIDRLQPAVDRAARRAHSLVDKAGFAASDAADAVVQRTRRVTNAVVTAPSRALDRCREGVREHPMKAVGIAALTGVALYAVYGVWKAARNRVGVDVG